MVLKCHSVIGSYKQGVLFKAVLGLQTALKFSLSPHVYVKTGIGIFGQQVILMILTICVWGPLLFHKFGVSSNKAN